MRTRSDSSPAGDARRANVAAVLAGRAPPPTAPVPACGWSRRGARAALV